MTKQSPKKSQNEGKEKESKKDNDKQEPQAEYAPFTGIPFGGEIDTKTYSRAKTEFISKQKEYVVEKDNTKQYFDEIATSANSVRSCVVYLLNDNAIRAGLLATNRARTIDSIGFSAEYTPFHLIMEVGPFCVNGPIGVNKIEKETGLSLKQKYDKITGSIVKQICRDLANEYRERGEELPEKSWAYINNDKDYWPFGKQERDDNKIIEDAKRAKEEKRNQK
eukprot:GHVR01022466.1.p1 GENE.GHVR01022466.1~~GHVR01022466.1.p1  ORF type:complete len:222 (-),score=53.93 GHVR01022466.1:77-742(-)